MAVEVNTERMGVQISWDPTGGEATEPPDKPDGIPTHPIYLPPYVDHELPGDQPEVSHPIFLPPYVDNSLPDPQPGPEHPIVLPPEIEEGLTDEQIEKIKGFLEGNLPETGGPELPTPVHAEVEAVQVFAQNMADEEDWSNLPIQKNTGLALISYPEGYTGEGWIEVRALDGSLVDCGSITVG
jgi:hypothetical protein